MPARLRILTANLWNGRADPEAFARLVRDEDVDVACVQETTAAQAEALARVLPHGRLEPADDHTGMGVALRRPAAVGKLPLVYRSIGVARLEPEAWPGLATPLQIWNLHVRAPTHPPPWRSLAIRREQTRMLLGHLADADPAPLVMIGDLNATPIWPVYRRIAAAIPDAALALARVRGQSPLRTWAPWAGPRRVRLLRIDHVFARGVAAHEVRRLPIAGSDHDALCVDVALD